MKTLISKKMVRGKINRVDVWKPVGCDIYWLGLCAGILLEYFTVPNQAKAIWVELTPKSHRQPKESFAVEIWHGDSRLRISSNDVKIYGKPILLFDNIKPGKYYARILYIT